MITYFTLQFFRVAERTNFQQLTCDTAMFVKNEEDGILTRRRILVYFAKSKQLQYKISTQ